MRTAWILGSLLGLLVVMGAQAQEAAEEPAAEEPAPEEPPAEEPAAAPAPEAVDHAAAVRDSVVLVRARGPGAGRAWGVRLDDESVLVSLAPFSIPRRQFRVIGADGVERAATVSRTLPSLDFALLTLEEPGTGAPVLAEAKPPAVGERVLVPYLDSPHWPGALKRPDIEPAILSARSRGALGVAAVRSSQVGLPVLDEDGRMVGVIIASDAQSHRVATLDALVTLFRGRDDSGRRPPRFEPAFELTGTIPAAGLRVPTRGEGGAPVLSSIRFGLTGPIGPLRLGFHARGLTALGGDGGQPARLLTRTTVTFSVGPRIRTPLSEHALRFAAGALIGTDLDFADSTLSARYAPWLEAGVSIALGPLVVELISGATLTGPTHLWLLTELGVRIPLFGTGSLSN